jgi:hypothetical protein
MEVSVRKDAILPALTTSVTGPWDSALTASPADQHFVEMQVKRKKNMYPAVF